MLSFLELSFLELARESAPVKRLMPSTPFTNSPTRIMITADDFSGVFKAARGFDNTAASSSSSLVMG
jgi:hypothetical protein